MNNENIPPSEVNYQKGDRIEVIDGKHKGRTGIYNKDCTVILQKYCYVDLDLKPRQRVQEIKVMIERKHIKLIT